MNLPAFAANRRRAALLAFGSALPAATLGTLLTAIVQPAVAAPHAALYSEEGRLDASTGYEPSRGLTRGADGLLYGIARDGGAFYGTLFRRDADGGVAPVHVFTRHEGHSFDHPPPMILLPDGALWGVQDSGGDVDAGTVFRFDPVSGRLDVVKTFSSFLEGGSPRGRLLLAADGWVYGTTQDGGAINHGTIFRIHPLTWAFERLHSFSAFSNPIGGYPSAGLTQGNDGQLYGSTYITADNNGFAAPGALFRFNPVNRRIHLLHAFTEDAWGPQDELLLGADGTLFGVTRGSPGLYAGLVYTVRRDGRFEVLHRFTDGTGVYPSGPLLRASDGFLYGQTRMKSMRPGGGRHGTAYRLRPNGKHFFVLCNDPDPDAYGALLEVDGALWGVAAHSEVKRASIFKLVPSGMQPAA